MSDIAVQPFPGSNSYGGRHPGNAGQISPKPLKLASARRHRSTLRSVAFLHGGVVGGGRHACRIGVWLPDPAPSYRTDDVGPGCPEGAAVPANLTGENYAIEA